MVTQLVPKLASGSQKISQKFKFNLRFLFIVLLSLGIALRCANIDGKVYWFDESFTSLRISGYTEEEVIQHISDQEILTAKDFLRYQQINDEKGLADTIKGLAIEEPQLTPLYFIAARLWAQWFGNSIVVVRSLSVLFSLLIFPVAYWLCLELFNSKLVGWVAISTIAISPLHLLFAQEARPYSLWVLTLLISSTALLRAIRRQTKVAWITYSISVAVGLYSFLFFGLGIISHGIYILIAERFRFRKTLLSYLLAILVGVIIFSPWIIVILTNPNPMVSLGSRGVELSLLVKAWIHNLSLTVFDFDLGWCFPIGSSYCRSALTLRNVLLYLMLPALCLAGYSIYFLCRHTQRRVWGFVVTMIGTTIAFLAVPDVILGGHRSSITRYLFPIFLGIQLSFAYLLSSQAFSALANTKIRKFWKLVAALLISLGVLSCMSISQADSWWNKAQNYHVVPMAHVLNSVEAPFLIYPVSPGIGFVGRVMPLFHELNPETKIQFVSQSIETIKVSNGLENIFIFNPSQPVIEQFQKADDYSIELVFINPIHPSPRLWKIEKI
ncbi:MAG: glycosyltransferase family 39 protein [Cyanobacteria bacterium J06635_10]